MASFADGSTVLGVYSMRVSSQLGSGSTTVQRENVTYWYVRQLDKFRFEVQPLTPEGLPSGMKSAVPIKDFLKSYLPEPFFYSENSSPVVDALGAKLLDGEAGLDKLDGKELAVLETLLGLSSSEKYSRGDDVTEAAVKVLGMLLGRCGLARHEHRVRFNSFAVTLRKDGHYDESIGFFCKSLEIERNDEHVYFNMARVYFDKGDYDGCFRALDQALSINPKFDEARKFTSWLSKRESLPG